VHWSYVPVSALPDADKALSAIRCLLLTMSQWRAATPFLYPLVMLQVEAANSYYQVDEYIEARYRKVS
jgi:hypothetical protein